MSQQTTTWTYLGKDKLSNVIGGIDKKMGKLDKNFNRLEGDMNKGFGKMTAAGNKMKRKFGENFGAIKNEFPVLGRAAALATNPITLAAGAIIGVGLALNTAVKKAEIFNTEFRQLSNLNLDKTAGEISKLKDSVLGLSFDEGFDPQKTSRAFFDVQSATGKFGKEVEDTVKKVGLFSRAVQADMNVSVEGASKAMVNFGFGVDKLDKFLASNFRTVQVGVTTFDQLAKVQTEFAGAAASAGQDFDQANKLFAVFTKSAKSVDIAATLTKGTFEDLGKASTVEGLGRIGVNIFDIDGKMRGLQDIVTDLVPKFQTLSDKEFSALIEDIGGNEGLRGLLKQAKSAGDELLGTFQAFDDTDFKMKQLLEEAADDMDVLGEKIDGKLSVAWIRVGDAFTPVWLGIKSAFADGLDEMAAGMEVIGTLWDKVFNRDQFENDVRAANQKAFEEATNISDRLGALQGKRREEAIQGIAAQAELVGVQIDRLNEKIDTDLTGNTRGFEEQRAELQGVFQAIVAAQAGVKGPAATKGESLLEKDEATRTGISSLLAEQDKKKGKKGAGKGVEAVTGGGARIKNIEVNVAKMVEQLIVQVQEPQDINSADIERQVTELFIKIVRQSEIALSSD